MPAVLPRLVAGLVPVQLVAGAEAKAIISLKPPGERVNIPGAAVLFAQERADEVADGVGDGTADGGGDGVPEPGGQRPQRLVEREEPARQAQRRVGVRRVQRHDISFSLGCLRLKW